MYLLQLPGTAAVVQSGSERLEVIDRSDVGARPLGRVSQALCHFNCRDESVLCLTYNAMSFPEQFSFSVDNPTSTDTKNGIETLRSRVKTGDYYSTLIIDESSSDETKVTVNV